MCNLSFGVAVAAVVVEMDLDSYFLVVVVVAVAVVVVTDFDFLTGHLYCDSSLFPKQDFVCIANDVVPVETVPVCCCCSWRMPVKENRYHSLRVVEHMLRRSIYALNRT